MKQLYWRPHKVTRPQLLFVTICALSGAFAVETLRTTEQQPYHAEKVASARLAKRAMEMVKAEKRIRGIAIDRDIDPAETGIIGQLISPITSNTGNLRSKQTSVNPNFAALVVGYLKSAGVRKGDRVAVGTSGSFPALNIAVYAAVETLGLRPTIIASASASQYGANNPGFLWIDMDRMLNKHGIFSHRVIAASLGAIKDTGQGISKQGQADLIAAIRANGLTLIQERTLEASVSTRMRLFNKAANGESFKAYINIGGGAASVGTHIGKKLYRPGLNLRPPRGAGQVDSVMNRFAFSGVPIVHLTKIINLATENGFPLHPSVTPPVGQGHIYARAQYNPYLAGGVIAFVLFLLFAVIRTDWGFRLLSMSGLPSNRKPPEQMV